MRIVILLLIISLSSCSLLKKVKHVEKTHEVINKDSSGVKIKDSVAVHESKDTSFDGVEIVYDKDTTSYIGADDYGIVVTTEKQHDGTIKVTYKSRRSPSAVKIGNSAIHSNYDSTAAHEIEQAMQHQSKTTDTKKVDKEVKRFNWWLLLLIIPAYLIYRYRKLLL